jgi:membrane fusion protein (multidrug efflux system)
MRALQADRFRRPTLGLLAGLLLFAAWGGWFFLSEVSVYALADQARLEVETAAHNIQAPVSGRVVAVHMALGREVQEGTLLFQLDDETQRLALQEEEANLAARERQLIALRQEYQSGSRALEQNAQADIASLDEIQARYDEAEAAAQLAEGDAERYKQLFEQGFVPATEYEQAQSLARQRRAAADVQRHSLTRMDYSRQSTGSDRRTELDQLQGEIARIEGDIARTEATIDRLSYGIEQRRVTAPIAGIIGEATELRPGSFVEAGDQLGSVVPLGRLLAVAHFAPSDAVGRIEAGQPAQIRLDGFPWTQYGSVAATVERLATELQGGRVRVELLVDPAYNGVIPIQHGLIGTLEVEVDRVSPAALVLRNAGKLLRN